MQIWNTQSAYEELVKQKKQFAIIYSFGMEWGGGLPEAFFADTMDEIRKKLVELTISIPQTPWFLSGSDQKVPTNDFHSMTFTIIRSHHVDCYKTGGL